MTVIDMCVSDYMNELTDLKACTSCHKMRKNCVLADIPAVCNEHVIASLIENCIELIAGNIECHRVSARIEVHLIKVLMDIDIGHDPSG